MTAILVSAAIRTELSVRQWSIRRVSTSASLYLDFEFDGSSPVSAERVFSAVLDAAPIPSALIRFAHGAKKDPTIVRSLITLTQRKDVAALLADDAENASRMGADGIHLPWSPDVVATFKALRRNSPKAIIGADAGRSRHDAMELGEAGADYVAFGIPPHVEDRERAAERQRDLIAWWSELFEVPCVAFDVPTEDAAHALAANGADFVAVRVTNAESEMDAAARVRAFSEALGMPEPAK